MITALIVPDLARQYVMPADAAEYAFDAHQLTSAFQRRTPLWRLFELRCSCNTLVVRNNEDDAFDTFHTHLLDATEGFIAQLADPRWTRQRLTAAAAPTPDSIDLLDIVWLTPFGEEQLATLDSQVAEDRCLWREGGLFTCGRLMAPGYTVCAIHVPLRELSDQRSTRSEH